MRIYYFGTLISKTENVSGAEQRSSRQPVLIRDILPTIPKPPARERSHMTSQFDAVPAPRGSGLVIRNYSRA